MFHPTFNFSTSDPNRRSGGVTPNGTCNGLNGWMMYGSGQSSGLKRSAADLDSEGPLQKYPAFGGRNRTEATMNFTYTKSDDAFSTKSFPDDDEDTEIELELVSEVAQTLSLNESSSSTSCKRKLNRDPYSKSEEDELVESAKRMRMDWDEEEDRDLIQRPDSEPEEPEELSMNYLAIIEGESPKKKFKSSEVVLSTEVRSMIEHIPGSATPESVIIERILKKNAMALVPYEPPLSIYEQIQKRLQEERNPKPKPILRPADDTDESDSDDTDTESIVVENPQGIPMSMVMEED